MHHRRIGSVILSTVAALAIAGGAMASASRPVTITVETHLEGSSDPFTATGGVVCASGTVSNGPGQFVGWQRGNGAQVHLIKHFECSDGTFDVNLRASLDFSTCDTIGTWSVQDGTGAYSRLRGSGAVLGLSDCGEIIVDAYTGTMHFD